jgi:GH25 family lysozyme M1 (1,4-beta-N-acetylmuramidase)
MAIKKLYGIDVSYYQGVINWKAVKAAGVEWVILRAGFGNSDVDTQFVNNITGAIAAGFDKIGVYWFSYAHDSASANTEAKKCLETIAPYRANITLPVFHDWESASYNYVVKTHGFSPTPAQIREIAQTWCDAVRAAGYQTGIYSNKSSASGWYKLPNGLYLWEDIGCEFWYARYGANNETQLFITPAFEETALSEHPETNIFQYSDVGVISGINSKRVDLNIRYVETSDPEPEPPTPTPPDYKKDVQSNGIEYVEIRDQNFSVQGIVDTAISVIWHSVYYGVGDFEIYVSASQSMLNLLSIGNYVTRPNDIEVGIIEKIEVTDNPQDGKMIVASGRFAKSILDRRQIYKLSGNSNTATILRGNVETNIRQIVSDNAISCAFDSNRNIPVLELGAASGIAKIIRDENGNAAQKQVSYQNLLEYTDSVLQEYGMSSLLVLNESKLQYIVYEGSDRSANNAVGNIPIIFSKEFDNLTESAYSYDTQGAKNAALIGGEGEGLDRFYTVLVGAETGLQRREMWVDGSSINRKYKDGNEEKQYTDSVYSEMLITQGKQEMSDKVIVESFGGTFDVMNGNYVYNRDFFLGDIVTAQDNDIGKYIDVRILEVTEVQDKDGYQIAVKFDA